MILMYHKVHPETPTMWWVNVDDFWRQMEELRRYHVVYMDEYDPSNPRHVCITFDGVYENVYQFALPVLKKFGYPFELYITSSTIGQGNEFDQHVEPPARFATHEQLKALVAGGGRLQWHTITHPDLTAMNSVESFRRELIVPEEVRALDPKGFTWFAYPYGKHNSRVVQEVKKYFKGALSCVEGNDTDRYMLNRITVVNETRFGSSRVSLIIANYNYGHFLAEAIESALAQRVPADEILVMDDCSADNSMEVAERYADRVKIVRNEKNLGIVANFNKAVSLTTGDYICFLGADNRLRSDYVEKCKLALDKHPEAAVAYTDVALFGPRAEVLALKVGARRIEGAVDTYLWRFPEFTEEVRAALPQHNIIHGSSMYRRAAFEQIGGYKETAGPEDHNLFTRMILAGWSAVRVPECVLEYRQHSSEQANTRLNYGLELAHLRKQYKALLGQHQKLLQVNNRPATPAPSVDSILADVRRHVGKGRIDIALAQLQQAFQLFAPVSQLHQEYASLAQKQGHDDEAQTHLDMALLFEPASADLHNELGVLAYKRGLKDAARGSFQRAVRLDPKCIAARKNLADIAVEDEHLEEAITHLNIVLDVAPQDTEALTALGTLCIKTDRLQDAEFFFRRVIQIDPANQEAKKVVEALSGGGQHSEPAPQPKHWEAGEFLVSIIIPVHNQIAFTRRCIEKLYFNTRIEMGVEVIAVDNASTDGTSEHCKHAEAAFPNFRYLKNRENEGFARACNKGAAVASGKYLVFLNNDTEVHENWLEPLLGTAEAEGTGIVGAKLLYPDGTLQHAGIDFEVRVIEEKEVPWPFHPYRGMPSGYAKANTTREVPAVTGACLMIEREFFHAIEGFDEGYPMYFEDVDLCMKAARAGKRVMYEPASVVTHHEGQSSRSAEDIAAKNIESAKRFFAQWGDVVEKMVAGRRQMQSHVAWYAPFFNASGYASEAINFAMALQPHLSLKISHTNNIYSKQFVDELPGHIIERLNNMSERVSVASGQIVVEHNPAVAFGRFPGAAYVIGRTMFETDRIPDEWVERCNALDEIWVPTRFNLETFARSGVQREKLVKIPGSIDVHFFDPSLYEPFALPLGKKFNFLSVFEWSERKGVDVLLRAYFEEFTAADDVCLYIKTYLMSRSGQDDSAEIMRRIKALAEEWGLEWNALPKVSIINSQIPLRDLPRLYKSMSAFVLPSRGEGWGRPHMEAMAMELPVIATGWSGNTEFMTRDNSYLIKTDGLTTIDRMELEFYRGHRWAQPSVKHLRQLMRFVVAHPEEGQEKGKRARRDIVANYSHERVAEIIINRLKKIEERIAVRRASRPAATSAATTPSKPNVIWQGGMLANTSLAIVNREICSRLLKKDFPLSFALMGHEHVQRIPERFKELVASRQALLPSRDIHVTLLWPPILTPPQHGRWVVMQPWEVGSLPTTWVEAFAPNADEIWAISNYVRESYITAGVPEQRVHVIPLGYDESRFHPRVQPYTLQTKKSFRFLFVGGTIYRKGIDILLDAYTQEFTAEDDVCLVIKDSGGDSVYKGMNQREAIAAIRSRPNSPEIEYINATLSEEELAGLYTACNVLTHPYRGEGFGLTILEAMACGIPAIVPNGGSCLDFCSDENSFLVHAERKRFDERRVDNLQTVDFPWLLEISVSDLRRALRRALNNPDEAKQKGAKAAASVREKWTWDNTADWVENRLMALHTKPVYRFTPERVRSELAETLERARELWQQNKKITATRQAECALMIARTRLHVHDTSGLIPRLEQFFEACKQELEGRAGSGAASAKGSDLGALLGKALEEFRGRNFDAAIASAHAIEQALAEAAATDEAKEMLGAAFNLRGLCHLEREEFDEARRMFESALQVNPSSSQACAGLGELFYLRGFDKEAKTMYEWGVKNDPANNAAIAGLAKVNRELGLDDSDNSLLSNSVLHSEERQ